MRCWTMLFVFGLSLAVPAFAQDGDAPEGEMGEMMDMPPMPPPLDADWVHFLVGEWKGHSKGPMGEVEQWRSYELGLDGQFLFVRAGAQTPDGESIWKGRGAITQGPEGNWIGVWLDNRRGISRCNGRTEEGRLHTRWEGPGGVMRLVMERVDDDTFEYRSRHVMPDGREMSTKGRLNRVE